MKAFILGNGPSINNVDTELLRGRFSIATNAIHKLYDRTSWRPQVLVIGDVTREHRAWVNEIVKHFLGAPFGGYKQSGIGREECLDELLAFTQEKNIHVKLRPTKA